MSEEYRPIRSECQKQFEVLHARFDKRDLTLKEHENKIEENEIAIVELSVNVSSVTKSISGLTKALWGLAGSLLVTLFGFVLWYIQSLPR